MLSPLKTEFVT